MADVSRGLVHGTKARSQRRLDCPPMFHIHAPERTRSTSTADKRRRRAANKRARASRKANR